MKTGKEKIEELIQHHKEACDDLTELVNELYGLEGKSDKQEDIESLKQMIEKYSNEKAWRKVFINQLEDLINSKNYKSSSNPEDIISNLDRYDNEYGFITKSLNGEYVLFNDVIKAVSILFLREKE